MAHDQTDDFAEAPSGGARRMVIAGVVGACALGMGLGLWARPAPHERRIGPVAAPMAAAREPGQRLQIILDDTPAPLGVPLDVLTAEPGRELQFDLPAPEPAPIEPAAPKRPPVGLMRVDVPVAPELLLAPPPEPKPVPVVRARPEPKPDKVKIAKARADRDEVRTAAKPKRKAKDEDEVRLARADKPAKAQPEKARAKADRKDRNETKLAKSETGSKARARAEKIRLARADDRKRRDEDRAEAKKRTRLASAVRAVRKAPGKVKAAVAKGPSHKTRKTELAEAGPEKKAKVRKAKRPVTVKLAKAAAKLEARSTKGAGPIRVAKLDRCAASDAGVALVCGNPELGAADRRLQRAYRDAEAAGVPASALQRQQQRWIAARSAAAREAPWAVRDVYQARIAELDDLTRDARQGY
ncbi:lysozyme inhibitor LprI family protein [Phenylobacterium sp.]|uniref:lysozyme inhibitor LprI family protein n=1 Tax=Phenylobacterium sp. TaxID=1871053 RepID=UPI003982F338